jgi:hypothetical protein
VGIEVKEQQGVGLSVVLDIENQERGKRRFG